MRASKLYLNYPLILLIILALYASFLVLTICWGIDKHFGLANEGFYMMAYKYPQKTVLVPTYFHYLTNAFVGWLFPPSIITLRIIIPNLFFNL